MPNPFIKETTTTPSDIVKEIDILKFFMEDINKLLNDYEPGLPENKPDVTKQINEMKETKEKKIRQQTNYNNMMNKLSNGVNSQSNQSKVDELSLVVQEMTIENSQLKDKVKYLEDKIKLLIMQQIQFKRNCTAEQN